MLSNEVLTTLLCWPNLQQHLFFESWQMASLTARDCIKDSLSCKRNKYSFPSSFLFQSSFEIRILFSCYICCLQVLDCCNFFKLDWNLKLLLMEAFLLRGKIGFGVQYIIFYPHNSRSYHSTASRNLMKLKVSWKSLSQHGSRTP